ncbi:hypothetical protein O6H91_13G000500 [Diphasiastrum complanatum]|uniref:Uncharacterized protein n=1 Tax=Diphasiastrum complanatum TaxID=34168 RepID=A0ACC2BS62_DIPCM|nr:hypothetical protein O6H91_13G000500 [Diphasiastrum complanatum]
MGKSDARHLKFLINGLFAKQGRSAVFLRKLNQKPQGLPFREPSAPHLSPKDGSQRIRNPLGQALSTSPDCLEGKATNQNGDASLSGAASRGDKGATNDASDQVLPIKRNRRRKCVSGIDEESVKRETSIETTPLKNTKVDIGLADRSPLPILATQNPRADNQNFDQSDKVVPADRSPSLTLATQNPKADNQDYGQSDKAAPADRSPLPTPGSRKPRSDNQNFDRLEEAALLSSLEKIAIPPELLDASAVFQRLLIANKRPAISDSEKLRLTTILRRFADRGWAKNQALAIYINSKFFPAAAARFRRFFVSRCPPQVMELLLAMGASDQAEEFLFPIFAEFCINEFSSEIARYRELVNSADLTKPHMWFPFTRAMKRKIVYHCGPTNSGKTYNALQRFMKASTGIYCCPLRLLAMEIYEKVNVMGVYCSLCTGQEKREVPFASHLACTVEMAHLGKQWEVAIVDEVQMMNDEYRGWAWTRAFLALQAEEIHVCGDPSALKLLRNLCAATGDEIEERNYERFMPLTLDTRSLRGDYSNIQAGDCVVAFSRREIFQVKQEIELTTKHRCCVVYGALPPETRTQQAKLFNDPNSGYDVLVASDAIGMGLNLNIKRVIFFAMEKFNGDQRGQVPASHIKQIAGRAGRRGSLYPEGIATTFYSQDIAYLATCLKQPFEEAQSAGLFPVFEQMELFASQLPDVTFAQLLDRFAQTCRLDGSYFLCRHDNLKKVANVLDKVPGLSLEDRFYFCFTPVNLRDPKCIGTLFRFATAYSKNVPVRMFIGLPKGMAKDDMQLCNLETQHQLLSMYLWLGQHFPDNAFPQKEQAAQMASQIATLLGESLVLFSSHASHKKQQLKAQSTNHRKDKISTSARKVAA